MVLVAMLSMDKAAVGGWRLLLRHLPVQAAAFLAVWIPMGMPFQPESEMPAMLAALPMLLGYPVSIAFAVHTLGRRVRRQNRTLRALNRSDALTGLGNRRAIEEALAAEFHRCERSGRPAALLLVDLDGFKTINDRFGHGFGDDVLRRVGLAIRGCVREIDTAARLGGDEFAVLLPETEVDTAIYVATRIRSAIGAQIFERAPGLHCTASIGVAGVAPVAAGPEGWMECADRALYRAKDEGRDCVRAAT
jgi:diguanylate cyclase